ncbi:MAG: NAD(P)H-hydrate dehydratase [Planctomycetota bacterium]|nr:NAD(P)H-hydrate dehydratase [Planctomycetota bacterium]
MRKIDQPPRLKRRPTDANKVSVGRVLVVGGSASMAGAPALAGLGALRAGAGLVKIAVPGEIQTTVAGFRAEALTQGLPQTRGGALGAGALPVLRTLTSSWDAVVLGPGMGRAPSTLNLIRSYARELPLPLLIDADALFAYRDDLGRLKKRKAPTVLTPHEGEAARLLDTTSEAIRADRQTAAAAIAEASHAIVVLKGPATLVTDGERLYRNTTGGPVLATGGSGDVLSGVIGALLAAGLDTLDAACAGVHAHGLAADKVAGRRDRGLLAGDLAEGLPDALLAMRRRGPR